MLRINQNISAMQGKYYLEMNGLRINKAADDPAGLVISEKYRAQVEGLQQAITNAKDGIGMIQTAEGAIDEMTKLLKNMRTLALAAANTSVNDTTSLQTDQDQINSMIQSFDRIVDRTKFGSKNLLDGSLGLTATTGSSSLEFIEGTTSTAAGTYSVSINSAASLGYIQSKIFVKATMTGAFGDGASSAGAAASLTFTGDMFRARLGGAYTLTVASTATVGAICAQLKADTTLAALGLNFSLSGNNIHTYQSKYAGNVNVKSSSASLEAASGFALIGMSGNMTLSAADLGSFKVSQAETLTFQDVSTGLSKQVTVAADTYLNAAASSLNTEFASLGINARASFETGVFGGKVLRFTSTAYGDGTTVKLTMGHNVAYGNGGLNLYPATGTQFNIADGASAGYYPEDGENGANASGTIDGRQATGSGRTLTSVSGSSAGLKLLYTGTGALSSTSVTVNGNGGLVFQVGAFQNQTVSTQINDLRSSRMGLNASGNGSTRSVYNIDVRTSAGAQEALAVIDDALSGINAVRGRLGSFQKDVLESTVRNLGVAKQNLASSESNVRDADMADEMLTFARAQILQQTGMAMLAQANQAPNQIMGLFR